jgi:hypothetical protein
MNTTPGLDNPVAPTQFGRKSAECGAEFERACHA